MPPGLPGASVPADRAPPRALGGLSPPPVPCPSGDITETLTYPLALGSVWTGLPPPRGVWRPLPPLVQSTSRRRVPRGSEGGVQAAHRAGRGSGPRCWRQWTRAGSSRPWRAFRLPAAADPVELAPGNPIPWAHFHHGRLPDRMLAFTRLLKLSPLPCGGRYQGTALDREQLRAHVGLFASQVLLQKPREAAPTMFPGL